MDVDINLTCMQKDISTKAYVEDTSLIIIKKEILKVNDTTKA